MRRRRRYRSVRPIISMFTIGIFASLGFSPGGTLFNIVISEMQKYIQYAALIALVILIWFLHDSILGPIRVMWKGYRRCGELGLIGMLFGFLSGFVIIGYLEGGLVLLLIGLIIWIIALYAQR